MKNMAHAVEMSNGLVCALPLPDGRIPVIDGVLDDWDLSAQEPVHVSTRTARHMHAEWAFMYDNDALYVSARVSLPLRPYHNPANPQDAFWSHDLLQLRLATDPALPYPLDSRRDAASDRVAHISFWKNSETGIAYLQITYGTQLNRGNVLNPPGSGIAIVTDPPPSSNTAGTYVVEARIPWSALKVPDGKIPFKPGDKTAAIFETLWTGGDSSRVAACFRENPGTFAFLDASTWGQLQFAPESPARRLRPTMAQILADLDGASRREPGVSSGVPVTFYVPEDAMKVSVNILGTRGEVLRELAGGEVFPKGNAMLKWDGRDNWGRPLAPGDYTWGAYLHHGLRAEFAGSVGSSGSPVHATLDGKGGWGGDHSNPLAVAADASGTYLLWPVSEYGKAIVKIDAAGRVLWRQNPFVGGGFGPFFSIASDGIHIYITRGGTEVFLVRIDAKTGALLTWNAGEEGEVSELPIYKTRPPLVPRSMTPVELTDDPVMRKEQEGDRVPQPDSLGLAVHGGRVYLSSHAQDTVFVIDTTSGKILDRLPCPAPRGLAFDRNGTLLATSFPQNHTAGDGSGGCVLRLTGKRTWETLVNRNSLDAPVGIAVADDGRIFVSDLGGSQQIKIFSASGVLEKTFGKKGGRAWQGRYDPAAFLNPAGLALDADGALVVAESSPPKVFSRLKIPTGEVLARWFGPGVYWNATWPMPDNPKHVFYMLNESIGRGRITAPDQPGVPDAYWDPARAGFPQVGNIEHGFPFPQTLLADNGRIYIVSDVGAHAIMLLGDGDRIRPVATWRGLHDGARRQALIEAWIDGNADGRVQPGETTEIRAMADGSSLPELAGLVGSMHMEANGDLLFASQKNSILKIPASGLAEDGLLRWDTRKVTFAVPEVLPGAHEMPTAWRQGILGVNRDAQGNHYVVFNTRVPGTRETFDYPDAATARLMMNGMGHTSRFNVVKVAKYNPSGELLWMAGRKATAGELPGEMYHFWNLAGLVNDRYVAGGSEWGRIYFYTHDGFFVDALMNNPGDISPPGPQSFGGETSGARVQFFENTSEVWAYSTGRAFRVNGFTKGIVSGERRLSGTVTLDKIYDPPAPDVDAAAGVEAALAAGNLAGKPGPLRIATLPDATREPDENDWTRTGIPPAVLHRNGAKLAEAWLGVSTQKLFVRIRVFDDSPLVNGATDLPLAFKGGDTAGIVIGPARDSGKPGAGDLRLMAAMIGGQPRLIAMKAVLPPSPLSSSAKNGGRPFDYYTPSSGTVHFDYVGEVQGGHVALEKTADGYVASFSVPLAFPDFEMKPDARLRGDVEIRISGAGARGLQTVGRHYLFTPSRPETSMTDDIPSEARLYPAFWGSLEMQ
ncbi:hypothetical protein OpiT1DRAFT_05956 [Opitutaceae bacterium TAV1]|nr:hypothetical protein OpiT1DRAFT_05956 [Opitutaceae bacterium TAV1]